MSAMTKSKLLMARCATTSRVLKNTGPRPGGSITAALFLQDFVSKDLPWAHLDIAGTVWSDKGRGSEPAGATGFGVRTLVNWLIAGAPCQVGA